ncbi:IclR family transcriptional regulator [Falsiroseomonas bella]|uniref:IclR family transcriptional regulator n=1 Tax=Falsiroseomonas bella TaxID=2184016 RepID=UPI0011B61F34|nr:IclR family transcriptional regulator [Falsiroseomonas bella]
MPDGARKQPKTEDALYVQSVEKAFRVLFAVGRNRAPMGLTQLAAASGLDRSAAQRFSHTLERLGYLRKDPRKRRFAITPRALEIGAMYLGSDVLVERGRPWLSELCRQTGETASLTMLDGTDVLYLLRRHADSVTRARVTIGSRLPAFCTSSGIAMLAALPRPAAMAVLEASDRTAFTARTVTDIPALLSRLDEVARDGYAMAVEELFAGAASIAVPVLGSAGEPVAAVHVTFACDRCPPEEARRRFLPLLKQSAQGLSRSLAAGGA